MRNVFYIVLFLFSISGYAQSTINAYARVSSVTSSSVLALANVDVSNHTFTVGGQVVVMQMQDNVIGTNTTNASSFGNLSAISNAGRYEIRTISAITPTSGSPTSLTLTSVLANTYNTGTNSRVQVISFRDLGANYTTTANISGLTWNGNVGGVVALNVSNTLTLNHRILADGLGFRGGTYSNNNSGAVCTSNSNTLYIANNNQLGFKGEGIYLNTDNNFNNARGKIVNGGGGGNDHNAGGGGGGNFTAGGQGGNGYNACTSFPGGGLGGITLSVQISASRIFMGGAGGGPQQNNSQNSAGGNGGGIILIKANVIATNTVCGASIQISANGNTAINGGNDGMGGGGAGGTIVLQTNSFSINAACPLTNRANGGNGGSVSDAAAHAGGGGGGQGAVIYSSAQPTTNITTQTNNGAAGTDNSGGSTSAGPGGGVNGGGIIASSVGPLPITLVNFWGIKTANSIQLHWLTASEINNDFFTIEKSTDVINFHTLAQVPGAGNSSKPNEYNFNDNRPSSGLNYYRLKQNDFDKSFRYFPPLVIDFSLGNTLNFSIIPNPIEKDHTLTLKVTSGTLKRLHIYNLVGVEVVLETPIEYTENEVVLKQLRLPSGVYFLKAENEFESVIQKFIVE